MPNSAKNSEFGIFKNHIFNNADIMNQIGDIFERFLTSLTKRNSVANHYVQKINPILYLFVTKWLGFGTIPKTYIRHQHKQNRAVIEQTDLINSIIKEFNEDT